MPPTGVTRRVRSRRCASPGPMKIALRYAPASCPGPGESDHQAGRLAEGQLTRVQANLEAYEGLGRYVDSNDHAGLSRALEPLLPLASLPELPRGFQPGGRSFVVWCAERGFDTALTTLRSKGADLGLPDTLYNGFQSWPVEAAAQSGNLRALTVLINAGSPVDRGRPLLAAACCSPSLQQLAIVRLLLEAGADPNLLMDSYGNMDQSFTLLEQIPAAKVEVANLLRSYGAKTKQELVDAGLEIPREAAGLPIAMHFERHYGGSAVMRGTGGDVRTFRIPLEVEGGGDALFTEGLSRNPAAEVPMEVYMEARGDVSDWAGPELAMLADLPNFGLQIKRPTTLIEQQMEDAPMATDSRYTAWLLADRGEIPASADRPAIPLMIAMPLLPSEVEHWRAHGIRSLLTALQAARVPMMVLPHRQPAV